MILALSEYLAEAGNEDLQREFQQKLVFGGIPNAKTFLQLVSENSTKKDKADFLNELLSFITDNKTMLHLDLSNNQFTKDQAE